MKVQTQTIAAIMIAGMVSGNALADGIHTVISVDNDTVTNDNVSIVDPKVTIQYYVDAAREDNDIVSGSQSTAQESKWEKYRIL